MTASDNRALVQRFVVEWLNERRRDSLNEICDPLISYHWGPFGEGIGVDGLAALEEKVRTAFPNITVEPLFTVADERYVVNNSIVTGSHHGTWFGLAPTGEQATWSAIEIYRIDDGRIAEQWLTEDWTSVLQQLGLLPSG